jgi:D-3-phosphoglycerate dehydrogenase
VISTFVPEQPASSSPVVELTFGLMLALARGIARQDAALKAGEWPIFSGHLLKNKTLGILGLGRLGLGVAKVAQAFEMNVVAAGITLTEERCAEAGVGYRTIDQLMGEADFVSVHFKVGPESLGILTREKLFLMKPSAFFINTARAAIIDSEALLELLTERRIAGAALDVFDQEPLPADHPIRSAPNVVLTAHTGWVHRDGSARRQATITEYLRKLLTEPAA